MTPPGSNLLLSALSPSTRDSLLSRAAPVELPFGTILYEPGTVPRHAHFLLSGLASIVVVTPDGASVEITMAGNEGVVGSLHLLGPASLPTQCTMQLAGAGLRVPHMHLQSQLQSSAELREVLLAYIQMQAATVSQISACNRVHSAEQRLIRWLLMAADKTGLDTLKFTQEYLAQMIATQRPTVTVIALDLQQRGLIQYSRGTIRLMDRPGLEASVCGCYAVIKNLNPMLYQLNAGGAERSVEAQTSSSSSSSSSKLSGMASASGNSE